MNQRLLLVGLASAAAAVLSVVAAVADGPDRPGGPDGRPTVPALVADHLPTAAAGNPPAAERAPERGLPSCERQHDTAILLVAFGSTYPEPHATYARQLDYFRRAFPDADLFLAFTSGVCIRRWEARTGERFYTPGQWLAVLGAKGYRQVAVQSLHIFPGQEYRLLDDCVGDSALPSLCCGSALLTSDRDIEQVAAVLVDRYAAELAAGEAVVFMGHGNGRAEYRATNEAYARLERAMQATAAVRFGNDRVFVGTVEYEPMNLAYVLGQLAAKGVPKETPVQLHP